MLLSSERLLGRVPAALQCDAQQSIPDLEVHWGRDGGEHSPVSTRGSIISMEVDSAITPGIPPE